MKILQWSSDIRFLDIPKGPLFAFSLYNYVYILTILNGVNTFYRSKLNEEENPTVWEEIAIHPHIILEGASLTVTDDRVYIIGGALGGKGISTVFYAPVKADRALGNWKKSRALPFSIAYAACVKWDDSIFLFGGKDENGELVDKIRCLTLNDNNNIEVARTLETTLPTNICKQTPLLYRDNLFLFGGNTGLYPTDAVYRISKTTAAAECGDKCAIQQLVSLPKALENVAIGHLADFIVIVGGHGIDGVSKQTYISYFTPKGTLRPWRSDLPLPYEVDNLNIVKNKSEFFIIGGLMNQGKDRLIMMPRFKTSQDEKDGYLDLESQQKLTKQVRFLNYLIAGIIALILILIILFQF